MNIRRTLTVAVGIVQGIVAALVLIFACSLYFNFFGVQTWLNVSVGTCYFHVLALLVFGFLSMISGLFLVHEWLES